MTIYMFCIFVWGSAFVAALCAVIFKNAAAHNERKKKRRRKERINS